MTESKETKNKTWVTCHGKNQSKKTKSTKQTSIVLNLDNEIQPSETLLACKNCQ